MALTRFTEDEERIIIGFMNRSTSKRLLIKQLQAAFPDRCIGTLYQVINRLKKNSPDVSIVKGSLLDSLDDDCIRAVIEVKIKSLPRETLIEILKFVR
ncbi:MAG: hypothetical protein ACRCX2_00360 [Paraclostridium sp.]